jgi:hypothetical protein
LLGVTNGFGQVPKGTITIRKTDKNILGKTLSLFDLRTQECGTIKFEKDKCTVHFKYKPEELKNIRVFLNSNSTSKKIICQYELISDTTFVISKDEFRDTCYYTFNNDSSNMVSFYSLPQGLFDKNGYAFFFGFDSVVYSQTYLRSLADFKFTDSISKLDSIYKNVVDPEQRKKLNENFKKRIEEYKASINYSYFAGKYELIDKRINLLNNNDTHFASLFLKKKGDFYSLFTHCKFDFNYPLISMYTHRKYGNVIFNYDKAYLYFYLPYSSGLNPQSNPGIYHIDTVDVNYPIGSMPYLYLQTDTFRAMSSDYFDFMKYKGIIGGYYECYLVSLNGLKIPTDPMFFGVKEAISVKNKTLKDSLETWNYRVINNCFSVYNESDTLIDEMKNGFESFRFTYKNNQPYVFGAYHRKNKETKQSEFIVLFANNKGVKITSKEFDYKYVRQAVLESQIDEKESFEYEYFIYSATEENLWIEYQNGSYEEWEFFNYNKAIRLTKGKKTDGFYLID